MIKRFASLVLCTIFGMCLLGSLSGCASEAYTPSAKTPVVSSPTIGKDGALRVGVDASKIPFAGQIDSGIVGLNVDIAAAIADELGLKLEIVDVGIDPSSALNGSTVDIVMGIDTSDSTIDFWTSDPYIQSASALFSATETADIPVDDTQKIAAQVSSASAWEVSLQFGEGALVSATDPEAAFADMASGAVSYVAADAIIGTYAAHKNSVTAHIVGLLQSPSGYSVGVLDENAELKQIVSDTLVKLQENGMTELIEKKWLGSAIDLSEVPVSSGSMPDESEDDPLEDDIPEDDGTGDIPELLDDDAGVEEGGTEDTATNDDPITVDDAGSNAIQPS